MFFIHGVNVYNKIFYCEHVLDTLQPDVEFQIFTWIF